MSAVAALRSLLEQRFPDAAPLARGLARPVATGVAQLDEILPGRGLPRGKLTAWHSEGGAPALLRAACRAAGGGGERAAWIDGGGTLGLASGDMGGTLIIRPASRRHALGSAEPLLRSAGLALVVLDGAMLEGAAAVRLARAAREGGAALVVLARHASVASLRLSSRFLAQSYQWALGPFGTPAAPREVVVEVRVRTLGWQARTTIALPVMPYELRLSLDPALANRRGAEQRVRRPARVRP